MSGGAEEFGEGDHGGIGKHGQKRLHAFGRNVLAHLGQKLHQGGITGVLDGKVGRTLSNSIRNRKLAGRENIYAADLDFRDGALVSYGKLADIGNLIAPKLNADRIVQRGGENIDNATSGGVLAALGHHVYVFIGAELKLTDHLIEVILMVFFEVNGSTTFHFLEDRLGQPAGSGDDDLRIVQVVQNLGAAADDVDARAQTLVRQCLPCRKHGHLFPQHRRKLCAKVFRLAAGGGHHQHRGVMGQSSQGPRPRLIQTCDVEVFPHMRNHALKLGVRGCYLEQAGQHWGRHLFAS